MDTEKFIQSLYGASNISLRADGTLVVHSKFPEGLQRRCPINAIRFPMGTPAQLKALVPYTMPVEFDAVQIEVPFEVETYDFGYQRGQAGDYLCVNTRGEERVWIIPRDEFERTCVRLPF